MCVKRTFVLPPGFISTKEVEKRVLFPSGGEETGPKKSKFGLVERKKNKGASPLLIRSSKGQEEKGKKEEKKKNKKKQKDKKIKKREYRKTERLFFLFRYLLFLLRFARLFTNKGKKVEKGKSPKKSIPSFRILSRETHVWSSNPI